MTLCPVKGDATPPYQALVNLFINARDAMPAGAVFRVEAKNCNRGARNCDQIPAKRTQPHIMITVSDTGIGMSPEVRKRVFEPFVTTKEAGKRTLGRSTVGSIVKIN